MWHPSAEELLELGTFCGKIFPHNFYYKVALLFIIFKKTIGKAKDGGQKLIDKIFIFIMTKYKIVSLYLTFTFFSFKFVVLVFLFLSANMF